MEQQVTHTNMLYPGQSKIKIKSKSKGKREGATSTDLDLNNAFGCRRILPLRPPSPPSWRAFTLIELMVVVVLLGVLSAMIIPEMRGTFEEAVLRSTSRDLIDAFQVAYSRAVSFNQPHRFLFDPATHRYVLERRVRENGREEYVPLRDVPGAEGQLDARVSVRIRVGSGDGGEPTPGDRPASGDAGARPTDSFSFYPDGTAEAAEVLLEDRQGFRLLLRLNPITARVRLVQLPRQ